MRNNSRSKNPETGSWRYSAAARANTDTLSSILITYFCTAGCKYNHYSEYTIVQSLRIFTIKHDGAKIKSTKLLHTNTVRLIKIEWLSWLQDRWGCRGMGSPPLCIWQRSSGSTSPQLSVSCSGLLQHMWPTLCPPESDSGSDKSLQIFQLRRS